jgi:AraC family transcriptional regulator
MEFRIEQLKPKKLVGLNLKMSLVTNRTFELWQSFMPRRKELTQTVSNDLYSIQLYKAGYFEHFNPSTEFEKWACAEVDAFEIIPNSMKSLELVGGLYAVFTYKGDGSDAAETFQHIFGTAIPNSKYTLDHRPHFELLGEKYKFGDPNSEEEIWIPVKFKTEIA